MTASAPGDASEMTETPLQRTARRYGPLALIVALVAVVALLAARAPTASTATTAAATGGTAPVDDASRPISFSEAKAKNLAVTFGSGCDKERGRIAIPSAFAPECFAQRGDNGGATSTGVTKDSIKIVVYQPPPDPIIDQIFAAIGFSDTVDDQFKTYQGYFEIYQRYFETYGRKIELVPFKGTGTSADEVAARADATQIAESIQPFAVIGGPLLTQAFGDELAKRKVIQIDLASTKSTDFFVEHAPYNYNVLQAPDQLSSVVAEYLGKRLKGKPAKYAGDPALAAKERTFGLFYLAVPGGNAEELRSRFIDQLKANGVELTAQVGSVDPSASAAQQVAKLKEAGVTSVLFSSDPLTPKTITEEATRQNYFPEWIVTGAALTDSTTFGRTYDQKQWAHAFGVSQLFARGRPDANWSYFLYKWYFGTNPPAQNAAQVIFPSPTVLMAGIMAAGPRLTPESFRDGLFNAKPLGGGLTVPQTSFGNKGYFDKPDYNVIDDTVEVFWDPTATGPDERGKDGTGMFRYVDGGKRHLPGTWPTGDPKVFTNEGSVALYEKLPPEDTPPDYPPPSR